MFTSCRLDAISASNGITADAYKRTKTKEESTVFKKVAKSVLWNIPMNACTELKQDKGESILTKRLLPTKSIQHTSQYHLSDRTMQHSLITLNTRAWFVVRQRVLAAQLAFFSLRIFHLSDKIIKPKNCNRSRRSSFNWKFILRSLCCMNML